MCVYKILIYKLEIKRFHGAVNSLLNIDCPQLQHSCRKMNSSGNGVKIGRETQLFVDEGIINSKLGVVRTLHPARKLEEPVLVPDRPWEGDRIYIYGTVYYDRRAQLFRMWYITRLGPEYKDRAAGLVWPWDMILYATSSDGILWEKPSLGLHEFDGSKENNILLLNKHSPTLIIDEEAEEPEDRYRMAAWDWTEGKQGFWIAHSSDGLNWKEASDNPIMVTEDEVLETITVAHQPRTGEYFGFHRRWGEVEDFSGTVEGGKGPCSQIVNKRRLVAVATSKDFRKWSDPELIFIPDTQDDAWTQDPEQRTEFYGMAGFTYGNQFLGFLPVFHVVRVVDYDRFDITIQAPWDGPIEAQFVHSRDGRNWHRFEDRSPIIPRGKEGSFDAGCILCSANRPVITGDEVWHYYTGVNTTHGGSMPPKRLSIGRAAWRLDGFVSLDSGPLGGVVETVPFENSGDQLEINVNAERGRVDVEVLSATGDPLPGYGRGDCLTLQADEVRHVVHWKGTDRLPANQLIRLRVHLNEAELYSFRLRA